MSALHEATESLKERARRALVDNQDQAGPGTHEAEGYNEVVRLRLQAIRLVRDLQPKCTCLEERVHELSQRLAKTAGDSVHYKTLLERLREAHEEWVRLKERLLAAGNVIRSTEWLVEILTDPCDMRRGMQASREVTTVRESE